MRNRLSRLPLNQRLAVAAILLGAVAIAANPYRGDRVTVNARELATVIGSGGDRIRALEVADWLVQGRSDFRLIDLRDERAFAEYHIPSAENLRLADLIEADMGRSEKLVLYSDTGSEAAEAWMLLRAKGYLGARIVRGGLEEWKNEVLFPRLVQEPGAEAARRNARLVALSEHFGGRPRAGEVGEIGAVPMVEAMPKVQQPVLDTKGGPAKKPAKKREGC